MEEETCGIRNDPTKGGFDVDALVTRSQEDANIARIDGLETALESNQTLYGRVLRTSPEAQLACERAGRIAYARAQYSIYDDPQGHHIDPVTGKLPYSFEVGGADFHGALKIDADYVLTRDQAQNEQINQELSAATSIADLEGQISAFQQSTEGVRDQRDWNEKNAQFLRRRADVTRQAMEMKITMAIMGGLLDFGSQM
ncbi:MAG: hypothetical protein DMF74_21510, partial [Acidobacteria bacterium]